jgi:hypothetical protein
VIGCRIEELCRTTTVCWHYGRRRSGRERDPFHQALKPIASKWRTVVLLPDAPPPAVPSPLQKTLLVTQPLPMTLWSTPAFPWHMPRPHRT